jgi:hypothetical protein
MSSEGDGTSARLESSNQFIWGRVGGNYLLRVNGSGFAGTLHIAMSTVVSRAACVVIMKEPSTASQHEL